MIYSDSLRSETNPKAMAQGVALTAAVSGSSGITVANNANINFGTGNFALVWKGSLPDWTPTTVLINKDNETDYAGWMFETIGTKIRLLLGNIANINWAFFDSPTLPFVANSIHEVTYCINRGTASVAGSVTISFDGLLQNTVVISAGQLGNLSNSKAINIMGTSSIHEAGTCIHAYTLNFAPTAAEVLDMYRNAVPLKWFDPTGVSPASQTPQTSGSLVVGKEYVIDTWTTDDDFVNVGGANVAGTRFVATGTTPTHWAHSSSLRRIGTTLYLPSEAWHPDRPVDFSGNALTVTYPTTGWSLTRPYSYATLQAAANNTAAAGLTIPVPVGGLYRTNADPSIICVRTV